MNRTGLSCIVLVALLATACAGGDDVGSIPTAPSSPTPPASAPPTPPPSSSCAPSSPTGLTVSITGSTRLFTWNASPTAADYFIQIGGTSGASNLIYTNTTQTTYSWTGAGPGTYYARVHARNSCGSSAPSNELVLN
ncbi:MAG TPA: fibronectin type III domain-containing protein [Vicinamibacterales bacterium]|nr:fibronectin type III domain-containing protein [Vicinamibacterales bacterium]